MALITCGGLDVLDGRISLPLHGAWFAHLRLDGSAAPAGRVTIQAAGGLSIVGHVATAGVFCDVASVQVVGGAGGLGKTLAPSAYQNAQLRDPLGAILNQAGESLSATVGSSVLGVELTSWTVVASTVGRALDELCGAVGAGTTWRVLADGSIWLGADTWPGASIPKGSDLLDASPEDGRYILGVDTPWLLPGVALETVGNVLAVDHYITPSEVRTWAWATP